MSIAFFNNLLDRLCKDTQFNDIQKYVNDIKTHVNKDAGAFHNILYFVTQLQPSKHNKPKPKGIVVPTPCNVAPPLPERLKSIVQNLWVKQWHPDSKTKTEWFVDPKQITGGLVLIHGMSMYAKLANANAKKYWNAFDDLLNKTSDNDLQSLLKTNKQLVQSLTRAINKKLSPAPASTPASAPAPAPASAPLPASAPASPAPATATAAPAPTPTDIYDADLYAWQTTDAAQLKQTIIGQIQQHSADLNVPLVDIVNIYKQRIVEAVAKLKTQASVANVLELKASIAILQRLSIIGTVLIMAGNDLPVDAVNIIQAMAQNTVELLA